MNTTILVGLRITKATGLSFFGMDEVNAAIKEGKQVTALEPGDALFHKVEDGENVRLTLSGFTIKVIVED